MTDEFPDGVGIFETLRTFNGKPAFLNAHLSRAFKSAKTLSIEIATEKKIVAAIEQVLLDNPIHTEFGRLRLEFHSSGKLRVAHSEYEPWTSPANVKLSESRIDETEVKSGHKTLPYRHNLDLLFEAKTEGIDEVIRLNSLGNICEGATANLLLKIDEIWVTPDISSGCLPGITRELALDWFEIIERQVSAGELVDIKSGFILWVRSLCLNKASVALHLYVLNFIGQCASTCVNVYMLKHVMQYKSSAKAHWRQVKIQYYKLKHFTVKGFKDFTLSFHRALYYPSLHKAPHPVRFRQSRNCCDGASHIAAKKRVQRRCKDNAMRQ